MFFSIDGIDGAGKTTQLVLFESWLRSQGRDLVVCRDPGSTPLGESVRSILLEADFPIDARAEMLLYMACRAQLVQEVIRPALASGKTVLSDRYLIANIAYQSAAGDLTPDEILRVGEIAIAGLVPDLTIVLDLPPELAAARLPSRKDRLERRGLEYFRKVRAQFLSSAAELSNVAVVDATQEVADVQRAIQQAALPLLRPDGLAPEQSGCRDLE